jgi:hypothetical protein
MPNYGTPESFLAQQFAPRRKERTELISGEIAIEIDVQAESQYERFRFNPYTQQNERSIETVFSGNGPIHWPLSGAEKFNRHGEPHLRSRFLYLRESGMPRERIDSLRDRPIPGMAVAVNIEQRYGRIFDCLDFAEYDSFFNELRLMTLNWRDSFLTGEPHPAVVVPLRTEIDLTTWMFEMRKIVDAGCAIRGPRMCRPLQNVDFLPTREQLIKSRKVKLAFANPALAHALERDLRQRADRLDGGVERYSWTGCLTPALAGIDDGADFQTLMPSSTI